MWICEKCRTSLKRLHVENSNLLRENSELKKSNDELKSRINDVESQLRTLKDDIKNEILQEIQPMNLSVQERNSNSDIKTQIFSCLKEERDRENRKLNLCIHNFPEPNEPSQNDCENLKGFISSKLNFPKETLSSEIESLRRIGALSGGGRPRSIILKIKSLQLRRDILAKTHLLKDHRTQDGKKIFIQPDMTRMQQEERKNLNSQLYDELRMVGKNVTIKRGQIIETGVPAPNGTSRTSLPPETSSA